MKPIVTASLLCLLCIASCTEIVPHEKEIAIIERGDSTLPAIPIKEDTCLFASAIIYPEGYDWYSDSLSLSSGIKLVLLKDRRTVLSFPVRQDEAMPGSHILMEGHLYHWHHEGDSTLFMKDGERLFAAEGKMVVKGVHENKLGLFTLSEDSGTSEHSTVLRLNGKVVFSKRGASPIGSLTDTGCGRGGALQKDGEDIAFCFSSSDGETYLYRESTGRRLSTKGTIVDVRIHDGKEYILAMETGKLTLYCDNIKVSTIPNILNGTHMRIVCPENGGAPCIYTETKGIGNLYSYEKSYVLVSLSGYPYIYRDRAVLVAKNGEFISASRFDDQTREDYTLSTGLYIASPLCTTFHGDDVITACSPKSQGRKPFLAVNAQMRQTYDFNGFFTGIEYAVSLSR